MADILKDDLWAYVQGLIKKEFSSKNNEEKVLSDKGIRSTGEIRDGRHSLLHSSVEEGPFQTWDTSNLKLPRSGAEENSHEA
ncbi:MAG: hypothetical protein JW836_01790 [Deltaproteobacteria bacterium]|nr:hypothetical protein [Deltaproteobacteria bacterium]